MKLKSGVNHKNVVAAMFINNIQHVLKKRAQYPPKPTYVMYSNPSRLTVFLPESKTQFFHLIWKK